MTNQINYKYKVGDKIIKRNSILVEDDLCHTVGNIQTIIDINDGVYTTDLKNTKFKVNSDYEKLSNTLDYYLEKYGFIINRSALTMNKEAIYKARYGDIVFMYVDNTCIFYQKDTLVNICRVCDSLIDINKFGESIKFLFENKK